MMKKLWILFLFVMLSCKKEIIRPQDIPVNEYPYFSMNNLKRQESFRFKMKFGRELMKIGVSQKGWFYIRGNLAYIKGEIASVPFEVIAVGDREFLKEKGKWVEHQKGDEAEILYQVERVFGEALLDKKKKGFKFLDSSKKYFSYAFDPNLRYLDPTGELEFNAKVYLDYYSLLIKKIEAYSLDSNAYFIFNFTGFNNVHPKNLYAKFSRKYMLKIVKGEYNEIKNILSQRFKAVCNYFKINKKKSFIELRISPELSPDDIKTLIKNGKIYFLSLALKGPEKSHISLRNNISEDFYIIDTLSGRENIKSITVKFDELSRPIMNIKLKHSIKGTPYIGVMIDNELYHVERKENATNLISINEFSSYGEALDIKANIKYYLKGELKFQKEVK